MSLIDGYTAANHLKKRLMETAVNNVGIMANADDVYKEIAENRIDVWIDEITTVEAIEIIRCKDCKHRILNKHYGEKGHLQIKAYCELDTGNPFDVSRDSGNDNWFCADAERR